MQASSAFFKKMLLWPVMVNLPLCLLFWWGEDGRFATTFAIGALVCWLANWVFAWPLLRKMRLRSRRYFLVCFYILECVKLLLYGLLFVLVLLIWQLAFQPMLLGFILNLCAYGLMSMMSLGDH